MPDVRIVGDAIEADGVVVAVITERTRTSRRRALDEAVTQGALDFGGGECPLCGRDELEDPVTGVEVTAAGLILHRGEPVARLIEPPDAPVSRPFLDDIDAERARS